MRIAVEATLAQGNATGVGVYVRELLAAYARVAPEHEYFLLHYTPTWTGPDFGPNFEPLSYRFGSAVTSIAFRLRRVLARLQPDVYHVTGATGCPPLPPVPVVTTVHDLYRYHPDAATPWLRDMIFKCLFGWSLRHSRHFIADSAVTATDMRRLLGIDPTRISVVHLAPVPSPDAPPTPSVARPPYLLCLGGIDARKGQLFLARVYRRMLADTPDLPSLIFVGPDRGHGPRLAAEVAASPEPGKLEWRDYVSDAAREDLYQQAMLFLMPSTCEGFGLPLLEAMARGVPVIASDLPVLREVGGDAARFVVQGSQEAWASGIRELVDDPAARAEWARRGSRQVEQFSWERCARETLSCLTTATGGSHA